MVWFIQVELTKVSGIGDFILSLIYTGFRFTQGSDQVGQGSDQMGQGSDQMGQGSDQVGQGSDQVGQGSDQVGFTVHVKFDIYTYEIFFNYINNTKKLQRI